MKKSLITLIFFLSFLAFKVWSQGPDPYSPARNFITKSNSIWLKWNPSNPSALVDLEVDTFSNFTTPQVFNNISSDSLLFTFNSHKTYYWRVKSSGQSTYSSVYYFSRFNPVLAGGLKGWFSALNVSQANNTSLQNWNSQEVVAAATNASSAQSPLFLANGGLGDKPMVRFGAGLRYLSTNINGSSIANTDPISFYFLGKLVAQGPAYGFIFTMANFTTYTPNQQNRAAYNYNSNANFLWASNGNSGVPQYSIASLGNNWRAFTAVDNTVSAKLYRNSVSVGTGASGVYSIHPNAPLIIGSNADLNNNSVLSTSQMDVGEMLFFNVEHNDSTRNKIEAFLVQQYLPPVSLGKDTSVNPLCGSVLLNAGAGYASYLWSSGATTPTYNVTSPGTYWVQVNDGFGHQYSDTLIVRSLSSFNQLAPKIFLCQGSQLTWHSQLSNQFYDFEWNDLSTDSSITISSPGFYFVKVTETLTSCTFVSDTVEIINDPFPMASLGNDTVLCMNNDLFLNQDAGNTSTFLWSNGETTPEINITNAGTYWVHATNENNCFADDTIQISVNGIAPNIDFSILNRCESSSSIFNSSSNLNPLAYQWKFGDGNISTDANPQHSYLQAGHYKVSLFLLADNGCGNTLNKDVVIHSKPQINFTYSDTCSNDSVRFVGNVLPISGNLHHVSWDFNDPSSGSMNSSNIIQPKHVYSLAGNYFITFEATNDSMCSQQLVKSIKIKEGAYPQFTHVGECYNSLTSYINQTTFGSGIQPSSYTWFLGNGNTSSLFNPQVVYNVADTYSVTLRVTTNNQCKAFKTLNIPVMKGAQAQFSMPDTICSNNLIPLQNLSVGVNDSLQQFTWRFGSAAVSNDFEPLFSFTQAGTRIVRLVAQTNAGCKDSVQKNIHVLVTPTAFFTTNTNVGEAPFPLNVNYTGTNATNFDWNFGNGISSTLEDPGTITYTEEGDYWVQLVASNTNGCKDTMQQLIEVRPVKLDVDWTSLQCIESNGKMTFSGTLVNSGNIELVELDLGATVNYGVGFREMWTGSLMPGAVLPFSFTGQLPLNMNETERFCCVDIYSIQGLNTSEDKRFCKVIENENWVGNIYPNPANNQLNIDFILKDDKSLNIRIIDDLGKLVYSSTINGVKGINTTHIDITHLSIGAYTLQMGDSKMRFVKK